MRYLEDGIYSQMYFSENFFMLQDVLDYEDERLWELGAKCTDYEYSIGLKDGERTTFYLEIFFMSRDGSPLCETKLFKFNNKNPLR